MREGMALLAQQWVRVEPDLDEPRRALSPRLRRRLGSIQSSLLSPSRGTADLSLRAPPLLDRGRCLIAIDGTSLQWIDGRALALGIAGCPIRKQLQLATLCLS